MFKKIAFFIFFFYVNSLMSQIVINEYSAANYDSFQDNYGEYEDWLELYNNSATAIDISGWQLSDKADEPNKWIVPGSLVIPANDVIVIFCSARDEIAASGDAHTNFKLTQTTGNEVIMLSDAAGVFQDSIRVIANQTSHSRGRQTNGSLTWSVFTTASPGANNVNAQLEYATTPVFSQTGGYYNGSVNLTISSPDPNVTIYYTTNGDSPDNTSNVYSGPINIAVTSVVKAIAYSSTPNIPPSFIDYHTFFINDTHTIPILSISGDVGPGGLVDLLDGGWGSTGLEPEGTIEWFSELGVLIDKGAGEFNKHGNDSWAYDQRGFDYIMRDQFGYSKDLKDKLFVTKDRDKFQRIILKAAANDNFSFEDGAHIRDAYVHHLSQIADLRMDERSVAFCIVYLNGDYWGVYDLREKVDDSDFLDYYYDQDELFPGSAGDIQYLKTWGGTWTEYGEGAGPGSAAEDDWDDFVNYVMANPMTNQANYNLVKSQFNTGSIIDYFLLNAYVVASDWLNWNTSWWRGLNPNGDKKKWRYSLWDMDATFDHYINYTGVPSTSPTADPCDPSSLGDPGGQGHVPIWNKLLTNNSFHDDYINRWQDLANGPFSCAAMVNLLDSMINIIDPEMPRQISRWGGGTYSDWQGNVTDLRNFILARCDSMNSGFVDCDSAITGIHNVTVEIIGVGEVEMSNNNFINNLNTPFNDERFGGVGLPFEVKSGNFIYWEVLPTGVYIFDPFVDTLLIDLKGDVTIRAYFGETRSVTYDVVPQGTTTSIDIDGLNVGVFPHTEIYLLGDTISSVIPNIDPLYEFDFWSADSINIIPSSTSETISFYATNSDTIKLHIKKKPTITYVVNPNTTNTSVDINGLNVNVFPASFTYNYNELITLSPIIDPVFAFGSWSSDSNFFVNGGSANNSFYCQFNDTIVLNLTDISAKIFGNDTLCSNENEDAELEIFFTGNPPFLFSYTDGINEYSDSTSENLYIIKTQQAGLYSLTSFSDANGNGATSGQARVVVLDAPQADFEAYPDSMTILYSTTNITDKSLGNIVSWQWYFGDNTPVVYVQNPTHIYKDSIGIYEVSLIISDDQGCVDTTAKYVHITDDYWIYIPNSFTPDNDKKNDFFCISYNGIRENTFVFNVYNRFSDLVYSTNNINDLNCENDGWDGRHIKTGEELPAGAYVYEIYYQDFEGWKHNEMKQIFILR